MLSDKALPSDDGRDAVDRVLARLISLPPRMYRLGSTTPESAIPTLVFVRGSVEPVDSVGRLMLCEYWWPGRCTVSVGSAGSAGSEGSASSADVVGDGSCAGPNRAEPACEAEADCVLPIGYCGRGNRQAGSRAPKKDMEVCITTTLLT